MAILKNLEKTKEWDQWIDNCKVIDKIDDDTSIFYFSYLTGLIFNLLLLLFMIKYKVLLMFKKEIIVF